MTNLYTLTDAAEKIGCHKSQTSRHAKRLGLGTPLGNQVVLTAAEVRRLRAAIASGCPGNPSARNKLGQFKKSVPKVR